MADPAWSNVWGLWHCDSANGDLTTPNTVSGGAALSQNSNNTVFGSISTTRSRFGTASILAGVSGNSSTWRAVIPTALDASSKITIQASVYALTTTDRVIIWPFVGGTGKGQLLLSGGSVLYDSTGGGGLSVGSYTFNANAWNDVAVVYDNGAATKMRCFVNGIQVGSSSTGGTATGSASFTIEGDTNGNFIDEIRGSYEALYAANYTPSGAVFPETDIAVGAAAATGSAAAVGKSTAVATGSSSGVGAASGVGKSTAVATGSSRGVGSCTAVGAGIKPAAGASFGAGAALAVGRATAVADGAASALGDASAVGLSGSMGLATGAGDAAAIGQSGSMGEASGIGDATAESLVNASAAGFSIGIGQAIAAGGSTAMSFGLAMGFGSATAHWVLAAVYPRYLDAVRFGKPIGPNNDPCYPTSMRPVRFGYPVSFHNAP